MGQTMDRASDERLGALNEELSAILEEKLTFLAATLKNTERLTQQIAATELDIKRNTEMQARLDADLRDVEAELQGLAERTESLTEERDGRVKDKYAREKEIQKLEWDINDRRKAVSADEASVAELTRELTRAEEEARRSQRQVQGMEEQVEKARKVRDEYMARLSGLKKELSDIAGANE